MPRAVALDEQSVEFQVALRDLRRQHAAPLWESAIASGDWGQMSDAKALDGRPHSVHQRRQRAQLMTRLRRVWVWWLRMTSTRRRPGWDRRGMR